MSLSLSSPGRVRELALAATGRPGPWRLVAPCFLAALAGWLAATVALVASADALAGGRTWDGGLRLAVHLASLVLFPFAVAGGAWHALPPMLRNDLRGRRRLAAAVVLMLGGVPLALGVAADRGTVVGAGVVLLGAALVLVVASIVGLVLGAPRGRMLVASRTGVALAVLHALLAFALGAALFAGDGAELFGVPRDRMTLVHLSLAALGWLALLLLAVGRVLAPMLALAPAPPARRFPLAEAALAASLWPALAGVALGVRPLALVGVCGLLAVAGSFALAAVRAARRGRIGLREAPLAHLLAGLVALLEAGLLAVAGLAGALEPRRAAVVVAVLLVGGFAAPVLAGFAGKLLSLSAWASWPPGPRPRQEALYPRRLWQVESVALAVGVQALAAGALARSVPLTRAGAVVLGLSAALALAGAVTTVARVRRYAARRSIGGSKTDGPLERAVEAEAGNHPADD